VVSAIKKSDSDYRIVVIGAGPGGVCAAKKLLDLGIDDFIVLERSPKPGGTWQNNRYPGLQLDTLSVAYGFSFYHRHDWTRTYALQPEVRTYVQACIDQFELAPYIRCNSAVTGAHWDEAKAQWRLDITGAAAITADIVISALGMFNEIRWPDIPRRDEFKGEVLHTAQWPEGKSIAGQRVAVIGSAASAVQMIPVLAQEAAHLDVYQRTANWVMPVDDRRFIDKEREDFRTNSEDGQKFRNDYLEMIERLLTFSDEEVMPELRQSALDNLAQVKNPATREKLTPHVPLGSQRPLFNNDYYPAFNRSNVNLVTEPIAGFMARGLETADGVERPADVVICATGYAANKFLSVIDVTGRDGVVIKDAWAEGPRAYLGITTSGFPNLFMLYGPNTNNGVIPVMLESQVDYILKKITGMSQKGLKWIDVKRNAMDEYNKQVQKDIAQVEAWQTVGSKYYRVASGLIVTQCPYGMVEYREKTSVEDMDRFETHPA
jgi:cyclohexanone monooxygenase